MKLWAFLFFLCTAPLCAQLHVLRSVFVRPNADTAYTGFMASTAFLGELQRGSGSLGGDQAWNIKIGGTAELYRWSGATLVFTAATELAANPYNDLGFNPRTAVWEEQLFVQAAAGAWTWQAGIFHRCKHEIDNTDPPNADTPTVGYKPVKRVLINSGIQAAVAAPVVTVGNVNIRTYVRGEWYAVHHDYRTPHNDEERSWERLRAALMAGVRADIALADGVQAYARLWSAGVLFGAEPSGGIQTGLEFNARPEAGVSLTGPGGAFDLFAAYERYFDEPASLVPAPSTVVYIGIRGRGAGLW